MRAKRTLPEIPTLPAAGRPSAGARPGARRWSRPRARLDRRAAAARPDLRRRRPPADWRASACCPAICASPRGTAVAGLAGYGEGGWWVQDISASMPARLLGAGEGRTVLDLCAAPGGKTMQLAAAGWEVTAVDVSESRLARLSENLARTGLAGRGRRRRRHEVAAAGAGRRDPARRALLGDRHLPPPSRRAPPGPARARSPSWPRPRRRCSPAPPAG